MSSLFFYLVPCWTSSCSALHQSISLQPGTTADVGRCPNKLSVLTVISICSHSFLGLISLYCKSVLFTCPIPTHVDVSEMYPIISYEAQHRVSDHPHAWYNLFMCPVLTDGFQPSWDNLAHRLQLIIQIMCTYWAAFEIQMSTAESLSSENDAEGLVRFMSLSCPAVPERRKSLSSLGMPGEAEILASHLFQTSYSAPSLLFSWTKWLFLWVTWEICGQASLFLLSLALLPTGTSPVLPNLWLMSTLTLWWWRRAICMAC